MLLTARDFEDQGCCLSYGPCPVKWDCPNAPPDKQVQLLGTSRFTWWEMESLKVLKAGYLKYWGGPQDGAQDYGE